MARFRSFSTRPRRWGHALLVAITTCVVVAFQTPSRASGRLFYVSPAGSDTNPGSETQPFATIQRAADLVNPGDVVIVEKGTYRGIGAGTPCVSGSNGNRPVVCISRGGTSAAWVTFRSREPRGARIDGAANTSTYGFQLITGVGFVRLEGFEVFGMGSTTHDVAGFVVYDGGHDVAIANNDIHDIGRLCADHRYGMSGIFVQNARVVIEGNRIHDIGRFAPGEAGCSPATTTYQNHDHGIYVNGRTDSRAPGARDVRIANNLFWNVARGWPVHVYPGLVENLQILNNTFAFPNSYRAGHILIAASTASGRIQNNLFHEPLNAGIQFSTGTHTDLRVENNLSSRATATGSPAGVTFSANTEWTDARIVAGELALQGTSPAVDAGAALADITVDIGGRARPQGKGWDIGAWESLTTDSGSGLKAPAPPSNLRIN